jgi:hypothetical protein
MGILAAGQVVIVHFPFSDLSQSKLRLPWCWPKPGAAIGCSVKSPANPTAILVQTVSNNLTETRNPAMRDAAHVTSASLGAVTDADLKL